MAHATSESNPPIKIFDFWSESAQKRLWSKSPPKNFYIKNQPKTRCWHCFWNSEMSFMQIEWVLEFGEQKVFLRQFLHILVKIGPQEMKNWLLAYLCMRSPKKLVPRRSADHPDSRSWGVLVNFSLKTGTKGLLIRIIFIFRL